MSSSVRAATVEDVAAIEDIVSAAYTPYVARIGREPAPMTVDYRRLVPDTHVLVDGAAVVGVLVLIHAADHLLVENVAVVPGRQGSGYGRALLEHTENIARANGLAQIRLYTNAAMTENLTFYPRLGYTEVERRTEDGFHRVYFVKNLDQPAPR